MGPANFRGKLLASDIGTTGTGEMAKPITDDKLSILTEPLLPRPKPQRDKKTRGEYFRYIQRRARSSDRPRPNSPRRDERRAQRPV
ncbi:protein of unknown function [Paraburkholderia kururiensis]